MSDAPRGLTRFPRRGDVVEFRPDGVRWTGKTSRYTVTRQDDRFPEIVHMVGSRGEETTFIAQFPEGLNEYATIIE